MNGFFSCCFEDSKIELLEVDSLKKEHRTRKIWPGEDGAAAAAGKLGSCRRRRTTSKIPKFGPDVPEIHKMFQKKIGPKRNPNQGAINLPRRIKPAGIQIRKEFSKN